MTKEEFVTLIKAYQNAEYNIDRLESAGLHIFESDLIESWEMVFTETIKILFDEVGVDYIFWWLYEKDSNGGIWEMDDTPIPCDTLEDFWDNILKNHLKECIKN